MLIWELKLGHRPILNESPEIPKKYGEHRGWDHSTCRNILNTTFVSVYICKSSLLWGINTNLSLPKPTTPSVDTSPMPDLPRKPCVQELHCHECHCLQLGFGESKLRELEFLGELPELGPILPEQMILYVQNDHAQTGETPVPSSKDSVKLSCIAPLRNNFW